MFDVIVTGGGPVGMGLAIDLKQRGCDVAVVEKHRVPQPVPKGQNLTQRTMEHFAAWGVEAAVRALRPVPKGLGTGGMTTWGTLLSSYRYDWLARAQVRPYYFTDAERLPQYLTEAALRARAEALDVPVVWEAAEAVRDLGDRVEVATASARLEGRYAVGCDGARSMVRQAAGIAETRRDHDRLMVLLLFDCPALSDRLKAFPDKSFYCVLHPDLEGYWLFFGRVDFEGRFFFHAPVPRGTDDSFDFEAFLHRAIGEALPLEITYRGMWDLRIAQADSYGRGRIFLAGDAAHSHPPYGGYGINTGFEDARNLGWKLAAVLKGWGGPGLLESYTDERHPVFASTAADFIEKFIADDRAFLERYSPDADAEAFAREWARRDEGALAVTAFEPNYAGSALCPGSEGRPSAVGSHQFRARAGHHLPPCLLSDGTPVGERLGSGFTLLAFGADPGGFEAAAGEIPLEIVHSDPTETSERYGAKLILVRPDHFVAWAGDAAGDAGAVLRAAAGAAVR